MKNIYRRFSQIGRIAGVGAVTVMSFLVVNQTRAVAVPVPTITWVYPNTDMEFEIGKTYPLQWTGVNPESGNYMVVLGFEKVGAPVPFSPGGYGGIGMGYRIPLTGSFNWKAGYTGSDANIRMAEGNYHLVAILYSLAQNRELSRDYSDGVITIASSSTVPAPIIAPPPLVPSVEVLAPSGGETLMVGATTTVAWKATNPVGGNYILSLGIEPLGGHFETGSYGILNGGMRFPLSGTYEWPVGSMGSDGTLMAPPGEYRFAVVLYSLTQGKELARDYSNATFMIVAPTSAPVSTSQEVNKSTQTTQPTPAVVSEPAPISIAPNPVISEEEKINRASEQIKALRAQLNTLQDVRRGNIVPVSALTRNLRFGMRNDADVRTLQELLVREGLYVEEVTGNFLGITRKAVIAFQEKYGIEATGFVGPLTRAKLNELYGRK